MIGLELIIGLVGLVVGLFAGLFTGVIYGVDHFYETIWVEVPVEFEMNVLDLFKHYKNMTMFHFPSEIDMEMN